MEGVRSKRSPTCGGGEVAHEGGVVIGVGELLLDLALPGHLHQVDGYSIRHHLHSSRPYDVQSNRSNAACCPIPNLQQVGHTENPKALATVTQACETP